MKGPDGRLLARRRQRRRLVKDLKPELEAFAFRQRQHRLEQVVFFPFFLAGGEFVRSRVCGIYGGALR